MEIMVVILILGLLATIVAPNVIGYFTDSQEDKARFDVGEIDKAVSLYFLRFRRIPALEDLIQPDERTQQPWLKGYTEVPVDPWENPYEIHRGEVPNTWEVLSYGPDKEAGTEDDISSKTLRNRRKRT